MVIVDYNIAAAKEPETACFNFKTATEIVNQIKSVLIWPKQPVQMSMRKIERSRFVEKSETWQQIHVKSSWIQMLTINRLRLMMNFLFSVYEPKK